MFAVPASSAGIGWRSGRCDVTTGASIIATPCLPRCSAISRVRIGDTVLQSISTWPRVNDFEMARAQAWHTETVLRRPQAVADEVLLLVQADRASAVRLTATLDRSLPPALGDTCAIERVLLNLVTNGRQAIDGPGEIRIVTRPAAGAEWIEVSVSDTGAGIAPDVLPRVFDPFFTTKNDGTGLGLSIVQRTVQDHGGTIDVRSARGEGTEFILRFPALPRPA